MKSILKISKIRPPDEKEVVNGAFFELFGHFFMYGSTIYQKTPLQVLQISCEHVQPALV